MSRVPPWAITPLACSTTIRLGLRVLQLCVHDGSVRRDALVVDGDAGHVHQRLCQRQVVVLKRPT